MDIDLIDALRKIDTPTISNAIERLALRNRVSGYCSREMKQLTPGFGTLCGYAATVHVSTISPDECCGYGRLFIDLCEMIDKMPKPVVAVFQETGDNKMFSAHCGEVMAAILMRVGAIGAVSDSGLRDMNEVKAMGFQYFAPGLVASHGNYTIKSIGLPVSVCGLEIATGDIIHGDINGLIKVPAKGAEKLPEIVEDIRKEEQRLISYASSGCFSVDGLKKLMGF